MPVDLRQTQLADDFRRLLDEAGFGHLTERLLAAAQLGLHVVKVGDRVQQPRRRLLGLIPLPPRSVLIPAPIAPGASRIGGLPEMPPDLPWPTGDGRPAQFLMQVRCADLAAYADHTLLPRAGMLWFFLPTWPLAPVVCYRRECATLRPATLPQAGKATPVVIPAYPLRFVPIPTRPDCDPKSAFGISAELDLETGESELDRWVEFEEQWMQFAGLDVDHHQIGGYASTIQGTDARQMFHIAANKPSFWRQKTAWQAAERDAPNWRLLLQFDSDADLRVMWGDAGRVYFGIREDDLRAERFDRVVAAFDCS